MAKRPKKPAVPAKPKAKPATVFQRQAAPSKPPSGMNPRATNGSPHDGLTRNRQKPGGGPGSAGSTTDVELPSGASDWV